MRFTVEQQKMDLGETSIENIFLNQYLQLAKGEHIKVYLFAYKNAKSVYGQKDLSDEEIAQELGLSEEEVKLAWNYWMEEGIVKRELDIKSGEDIYTFLSMRELYLGFAEPYEYVSESEKFVPQNSNEIKEMYEGIEEVLGIELQPNEYERILEHMTDFGQTPELIVKGFQYSAEKRGKKNLNYVLGVLRNWHLDEINTLEDFDKAQEELQKRRQNIKRKRKYYKPGEMKSGPMVTKDREETPNLSDLFQEKFLNDLHGDKK